MLNQLQSLWRTWRRGREHAAEIRRLKFASYDDYVAAQLKTNAAKRDRVWVRGDELQQLAKLIAELTPGPRFGLCHGVRNGAEVRTLRELLHCEIWGTEISPSAAEFPFVIQWDFHKLKPEWLGRADFIYSNSLDHSYDPTACLAGWLSCLSSRGRCYVHWSQEHDHTDFGKNGSDCFQATRNGYVQLIESVGRLEEVIETDPDGQRCLFVCRSKAATVSAAA